MAVATKDVVEVVVDQRRGYSKIASNASFPGIVDVTSGNNSFAGVTGYNAGPGYDLASGLGTIDAYKFVTDIAHLTGPEDGFSG